MNLNSQNIPQAQDDFAPADYSYVPSVSEGRRIAQGQKMHRDPRPAPVARADYGIPEDPFNPPPETQQPQATRRRRAQQSRSESPIKQANPEELPKAVQTASGSQFEAPGHVEVPDWLRVAQQNNMPLQRPQGPRVQSAPRREPQDVPLDALGRPLRRSQPQRSASPYEQAGYPPELLEMQRQLEAEQAAQPIRRRHGAQYAARPQAQYAPPPTAVPSGMSYPPPRQQMEEPKPVARNRRMHSVNAMMAREEVQDGWTIRTDEKPRSLRRPVPWLAILASLALVCAVALFGVKLYFQAEQQQVIQAREEKRLSQLERHPLLYRDLIESVSSRYNLSPAFVASIILNESSFKPEATSHVNARGLMQLMDDTASWIYPKLGWDEPYHFDDLYEPEINVEYGCWYLNYLAEIFRGDPVLVAAAFHAGQNEVQNWLNDGQYSFDGFTLRVQDMMDGPTKQYVERVLKAYAVYKRLYYGG